MGKPPSAQDPAALPLESLLFSQGFGSRRQCRALISAGRVRIAGGVCDDHDKPFETANLVFSVDHVDWPFHAKAYLMLNKPAGVECSQDPQHHASVFSLLPVPLRERGVQCVGRLDQDTTGLLLFSDDGAFIHALASPKRKVSKRYRAGVRHPLDDEQLQALREGVLLHGESAPSVPQDVSTDGAHTLLLTIAEGKYHQVKRMVAAAGNRVESLHREAMGSLALPGDLPAGAWRWLNAGDLAALRETGRA